MQQSTFANRSPLSRAWERALDIAFPPRCVSCGEFGAFICNGCLADAAQASQPRCAVCWATAKADWDCDDCSFLRPAFKAARSPFIYEAAARDAVHALKYKGVSALAPVMARPMAELLMEWAPPVQIIVPVPLTGHRSRVRGFNQSQLLARELSRLMGLPVETRAIRRRSSGSPQVGQPDREARRRNVAEAFSPGSRSVEGGILLIDDVMTTGATLDACTRVLLAGGAGAVYTLTFARGL